MGAANLLAAAGGSGQGGQSVGGFDPMFFLTMIAMFAVIYFLMLRPQQKQRRQLQDMLKNLKKGDDVVTSGGIYGKIIELDEHTVELKIAEGTKIKVERARIGRVVTHTG